MDPKIEGTDNAGVPGSASTVPQDSEGSNASFTSAVEDEQQRREVCCEDERQAPTAVTSARDSKQAQDLQQRPRITHRLDVN